MVFWTELDNWDCINHWHVYDDFTELAHFELFEANNTKDDWHRWLIKIDSLDVDIDAEQLHDELYAVLKKYMRKKNDNTNINNE
jgi:hypothetical protein